MQYTPIMYGKKTFIFFNCADIVPAFYVTMEIVQVHIAFSKYFVHKWCILFRGIYRFNL